MSNRLSFNRGLAYQGTNAVQPPECHFEPRNPTTYDTQGVSLLDFWLNTVTEEVWVLVSLAGNSTSNGSLATWVKFGSGDLQFLTSNSGGPVPPDVNFNINVVGDGTTITGVGNPATSTITFSTVGTGVVSTLTGNSGGAVSPLAGNINVVGDATTINIVGNPGTHTLTASTTGIVATSFQTDNGTAVPAAGVIDFNAVSQAGSSVSFSGATNIVRLNTTDSGGNVLIGLQAGNATLTGTANTGLGFSVLHGLTTGTNNTVIGDLAGTVLTTGGSNTIIGKSAGNALTTGSTNTIIGQGSASGLLTGTNNIIIGQNSGSALTGAESLLTLIGSPGQAGVSSQIIITLGNGGDRWIHNIGGTFVGRLTGNLAYAGTGGMTGLGENALNVATTATDCTVVGQQAGAMITTGSSNTIVGKDAGHLLTTGQDNTIIGTGAAFNGIAAGLLTGSNNILIGFGAGNAYTAAESNNIIIGTSSAGVPGETDVIRIGFSTTPSTKTFIDGIRGKTTVNADAVAVLVDSAGQLGTVSSSERYKENINDIGSLSEDITQLRPVIFNYKNHLPEETTYGLIAEEVNDVFPELVVKDKEGNPDTIKYHELPILLLNELIKVKQELELLKKKIN